MIYKLHTKIKYLITYYLLSITHLNDL
jgi:hypothetical protein